MTPVAATAPRGIAPDLWTVDREIRLPAGLRLPLRATLARLADGSLWIHSPVRFDDADAAAIAALGPVRHVVAPSLYHHLHAAACVRRFPDATLWAPPGFERKSPGMHHEPFGERPPGAWGDAFDQVRLFGAPRVDEHVFFHRATATLICADLLFNVRRPANLVTRLILTLTGTRGRLAQSRAWCSLVRDRPAFRAALERILAWPFRRVLMGHGDVLEDDRAPALVRAALRSLR